MVRRVKVSIRVFGYPLDMYLPLAQAVEELGFYGVWIPDHVVSPLEIEGKYPYSKTGQPSFVPTTPFADPFVMIGHLAAGTQRIHLGVGVYILPLRDPVIAARMALSAQELSHGRLLLGVGIGWMEQEFSIVNTEFVGRGARTEEMLDVMRLLWRGEPASHHGRWYSFDSLQMSPSASSPIPILLGGSGPKAIIRAAKVADGWYGPPSSVDSVIGVRNDLQHALDEQGRSLDNFRMIVRAAEPSSVGSVLELADSEFDDVVVNLPRDLQSLSELTSWLEQFASDLTTAGVGLDG
jgi:probable F420-dependent oxidoreductase